MDNGPIRINIEEIVNAMECMGEEFGEIDSYLNIRTGKVIDKMEHMDYDFLEEQLDGEEDEEDPDDLVHIPKIESRESYIIMEDFVSVVRIEKLQKKLIEALNRNKPFFRFKNTLTSYPDQEILWYEFRENQMKERAKEWLDEQGLNYTLFEPYPRKSVVELIQEKEEHQQKGLQEFVENAQRSDYVIGILLSGSLVKEERMGADVDILLFIDQDMSTDIKAVAKAKRRIDSQENVYLDVYVLGNKGEFFGNICFRKNCPTNSVDCNVPECGKIKLVRQFYDFEWDWRKIGADDVKYLYIKKGYDEHFFKRLFGAKR